ncbi:hypothetical protein BC008_25090 [Mastigocoleus testarum BC008]|uniref:Peptidase metallopeptidase domain-containing protein n=1 Tax=Mastigocoleus testarum BC008 TaxID=371196 RepID=A0A0V7ZPA1_9CYAN|nr:hypothetical protein BC008_25090 [Mastigocoleus testarum BC008]
MKKSRCDLFSSLFLKSLFFKSLLLVLNLILIVGLFALINLRSPAFSETNLGVTYSGETNLASLDIEIQNSSNFFAEANKDLVTKRLTDKELDHQYITRKQSLPALKAHLLPSTLREWQDTNNSGDYFSEIKPTPVGYLVWSQFPVKIYITTLNKLPQKQAQTWVETVSQVVNEWQNYLPLQIVYKADIADIIIERKAPPLQFDRKRKISRARSAQTTYEFYTKNNTLYHRFTILLSPSQTGKYLLAATRHEIGHALGIWGHSPVKSDALYFSQVRNPPPISPRDVNTLKRIYKQPTSLGWSLP